MKIALFSLLSFLLLTGCGRYAARNAAADSWLESSRGSKSIDLTGNWEAEQFGWGGSAEFKQTGNQIEGTFGFYNVSGVVNGSEVSLVMSSGRASRSWPFYSAVLRKKGSKLVGEYSGAIPFSNSDDFDHGPLSFQRLP